MRRPTTSDWAWVLILVVAAGDLGTARAEELRLGSPFTSGRRPQARGETFSLELKTEPGPRQPSPPKALRLMRKGLDEKSEALRTRFEFLTLDGAFVSPLETEIERRRMGEKLAVAAIAETLGGWDDEAVDARRERASRGSGHDFAWRNGPTWRIRAASGRRDFRLGADLLRSELRATWQVGGRLESTRVRPLRMVVGWNPLERELHLGFTCFLR